MYDFRNMWAEELDKAWGADHAKDSMPDWVYSIIDRAAIAAMGRVAALEMDQWQPIETAPKNKSVLCRMENNNCRVLYQTDPGEGLMSTWRNPEDGTAAGWPTNWQPLPSRSSLNSPDAVEREVRHFGGGPHKHLPGYGD